MESALCYIWVFPSLRYNMAASNQDRGPFETAMFKVALQLCYKEISENIQSSDFCSSLFSKNVVSMKEHEHLKREQDNKGSIAHNELALRYLLDKSAREFWLGMDVLQSIPKGEPAHRMIEDTANKIRTGKVPPPQGNTIMSYLKHKVSVLKLKGSLLWPVYPCDIFTIFFQCLEFYCPQHKIFALNRGTYRSR